MGVGRGAIGWLDCGADSLRRCAWLHHPRPRPRAPRAGMNDFNERKIRRDRRAWQSISSRADVSRRYVEPLAIGRYQCEPLSLKSHRAPFWFSGERRARLASDGCQAVCQIVSEAVVYTVNGNYSSTFGQRSATSSGRRYRIPPLPPTIVPRDMRTV